MNYKKLYLKIIRNAMVRNPNKEIFYEKHHIFPRSIFGDNKYVALLTLKEHYLVHKILYKYYIKKYGIHDIKTVKMMHALYVMSNKHLPENRKTNSRTYAKLREQFCKRMSENFSGSNNPMFGIKNIGEKNHFYGKRHTEETKEKIRIAKIGKKQSKETINKRSGINHPYYGKKREAFSQNMKGKYTGKDHWSYGKVFTEEQKDNLRRAMIGKNAGKISPFRKKIERINPETGETIEYESISQTLKEGFLPSKVSLCCKGIRKMHKGYYWKFIGEDDE